MITDGKKWHYLAVKKLTGLLTGVTSKYVGDFQCLKCLHWYRTEHVSNELNMNYNVSKNHDYCYLEIPNEENKILKYNHGEKSIKVPFVIHVD